jgi:hypothetical protein
MARIENPSPKPPFVLPRSCCGAARQTGLSLQLQKPSWPNSHNADKTDLATGVVNDRFPSTTRPVNIIDGGIAKF